MAPTQSQSSDGEPPNPRGAELTRFCIAFTTTAGIFVFSRIGIRWKRKVLGWDDFWIVIAFIFSILLMATIIAGVKSGLGLPSDQVAEDRVETAMFWWYINQIFYKSIIWSTKVSILLMYRRVFLVDNHVKAYGVRFRSLIWMTLAVVVGCYIGFETAGIFQCTPIRRTWNRSIPGKCLPMMPRMYAHAGCNFVTDVIILLLPMPLIRGMEHLSKRQRIGLMGIFAVGGFVCATTLTRMTMLRLKSDILYSVRDSSLWTIIEANVGIICACLPLMRSMILYLLPYFCDCTKLGRQSRRWTGEESFTSATGSHYDQQSSENNGISNDKDGVAIFCIEEEASRSDITIPEKVHEKTDFETLSGSDYRR